MYVYIHTMFCVSIYPWVDSYGFHLLVIVNMGMHIMFESLLSNFLSIYPKLELLGQR